METTMNKSRGLVGQWEVRNADTGVLIGYVMKSGSGWVVWKRHNAGTIPGPNADATWPTRKEAVAALVEFVESLPSGRVS